MKKLNLNVNGDRTGDLVEALLEVVRLVEDGFTEGSDTKTHRKL